MGVGASRILIRTQCSSDTTPHPLPLSERTATKLTWSYSEEWTLSPQRTVRTGDPVKIKGKRGTFRFGCVNLRDGVAHSVEVVGPVGGHHELSRVYTVDRLQPAPGKTRADVAARR